MKPAPLLPLLVASGCWPKPDIETRQVPLRTDMAVADTVP